MKHSIMLAKEFHMSELILRHDHEEVGHGGRNHMLARLHQRYSISGATVSIRTIVSKCVVCQCLNGTPGQQQIAD